MEKKSRTFSLFVANSSSSDEEIRAIQKERGVDAVIVDNLLKVSKRLREKEQISNVLKADQYRRAANFGAEASIS